MTFLTQTALLLFLDFYPEHKQFGHTLEFRVKMLFCSRHLVTSHVGLEGISVRTEARPESLNISVRGTKLWSNLV